jgi:sugar phosphate permease
MSYRIKLSEPDFILLFGVVGFLQSSIWPITLSLISTHCVQTNKGKTLSLWAVSSAFGDTVGYLYSSKMLSYGFQWLSITIISLMIYTFINIISWTLLKNPEDTKSYIKVSDIIRLPTIWNYCICYFCTMMLHIAIVAWLPYYVKNVLNAEAKAEKTATVFYVIGGAFGGVSIGFVSDRIKEKSYLLGAMLVMSIPILNLLMHSLGNSDTINFAFVSILGGLVNGGCNLIIIVTNSDLYPTQSQLEPGSTLTGIVAAFGGLGLSVSQMIVIFMQTIIRYEYSEFILYGMIIINALGLLSVLPIIIKGIKNKKYSAFSDLSKLPERYKSESIDNQ